MKTYVPVAVIKDWAAFDWKSGINFTNFDEAENQFKTWQDEGYILISWWINIYEGVLLDRSVKRINMDLVKELWEEFGDVPMNPETECIEYDWGWFEAGDEREEIWHWFEETFDVSVAELMGIAGEEE